MRLSSLLYRLSCCRATVALMENCSDRMWDLVRRRLGAWVCMGAWGAVDIALVLLFQDGGVEYA